MSQAHTTHSTPPAEGDPLSAPSGYFARKGRDLLMNAPSRTNDQLERALAYAELEIAAQLSRIADALESQGPVR